MVSTNLYYKDTNPDKSGRMSLAQNATPFCSKHVIDNFLVQKDFITFFKLPTSYISKIFFPLVNIQKRFVF